MDTDLEALKKSLPGRYTQPSVNAELPTAESQDVTTMLSNITGEIQHLSRGINKLQITVSELKPSTELFDGMTRIMSILSEIQNQQESLREDVKRIIGNIGFKK